MEGSYSGETSTKDFFFYVSFGYADKTDKKLNNIEANFFENELAFIQKD